jgi:hypothetical protein
MYRKVLEGESRQSNSYTAGIEIILAFELYHSYRSCVLHLCTIHWVQRK